jgi:magnesium-transporting ATPase (P-type)
MSTVIENKEKQGGYRVFSKGASEIILKKYVLTSWCIYIYVTDANTFMVVMEN